jgi:hypothetical protein
MNKIKIDKSKFTMLSEDFPEYATREEIEHEIKRLKRLSKYYYNKQWAEKTVINSSYGALASKYFVGFNLDVAASVTEMGRNIVQFGSQILDKYFLEYWHKDTELHKKLGLLGQPIKLMNPVLRYGDTDSNYISLEHVIEDLVSRNLLPDKYLNDLTQFILDLMEFRLNEYINEAYEQFAKKYGTENIQKFELENVLYKTLFLAKKKYVGELAWKEGGGKIEPNQKLKITGIEIVQSSTPKFCRDKLRFLIKYIFKHANDFSISDFLQEMNKIKQEFKIQNIEDISFSKSVGNYEKFIIDDKKQFTIAGGCPIHVRGAGYHNYMLNNNKEFGNKYKHLKTGDKIKMYHSLDEENNVFSFSAGDYPYEIAPEMNIDLQFEKTMIDPINRLLKPMGITPIRPTLVTTKSLF